MREHEMVCINCGHNCSEDCCNFVFTNHQIVECGHCEVRKHLPAFHEPLLNVAEQETLSQLIPNCS